MNIEVTEHTIRLSDGAAAPISLIDDLDAPEKGTIISTTIFAVIAEVVRYACRDGFAVQARKIGDDYSCKVFNLPGATSKTWPSVRGEGSYPQVRVASQDPPLLGDLP